MTTPEPEIAVAVTAAVKETRSQVYAEIRQLALRKRAVYCKPCDGKPCDYDDELASFADLIGEQLR